MDPYINKIKSTIHIHESTNVKNFNNYDLTILCTDHYKFNL